MSVAIESIGKNAYVIKINSLKVILAIIYLYTLLTNFSIPIINTVLIVVMCAYAIFAKGKDAFALTAFFIIYFNYSYLDFSNYLNLTIGQFITIYMGIFVIRFFPKIINNISENKFIILKVALGLVLPILLLFQQEFVGAIRVLSSILFAVCFVSACLENGEWISQYIKVLIFSLLSTYLYNLIYIQILGMNSDIADLVVGRYCGVRDANNFALYSNIAIILLLYSKSIINTKKRNFILTLLGIGVLLTISMSGIVSLCAIFCYMQFKNKNVSKKTAVFLIGIPFVLIIIMMLVQVSQYVNIGGPLGTILERITTILNQLSIGDYSSATSSRTYLWGYYADYYNNMDSIKQIFGSYSEYAHLITTRLGSHNTYLDFLITYGGMGLFSILAMLLIPSKKHGMNYIWVLKILFVINIFARSFDVLSANVFMFIML